MLKKSTALRNFLLGLQFNKVRNPNGADTVNWIWATENATISQETITEGSGQPSGVTTSIKVTPSATTATLKQILKGGLKSSNYKLVFYATGYLVSVKITDGTTDYWAQTVNKSDAYDITSFEKKEYLFNLSSNTPVDNTSIVFSLPDDTHAFGVTAVSLVDLEDNSVKHIFTGGTLTIYTGNQPGSADDAVAGTKLVEFTGITFEEPSNGTLSKDNSSAWTATAVESGTAGWFRLKARGDDDAASTDLPRIDGAIATSGAELNMSNTYIENSSLQTISSFNISISE